MMKIIHFSCSFRIRMFVPIATIIIFAVGLLHGQKLSDQTCNGTNLLKYKDLKCGRDTSCPNTFKCVQGECCQYKDVPRCEPEINPDTHAPWPCKGGESKRCSNGYECVSVDANRYTLCCLNVTCVDLSGFTHNWYDNPWISNEDKCNKCTCLKRGDVDCSNKKGCKRCSTPHGTKKSPYQYWKDNCTQCTCISKKYTYCTTACDRGIKGSLTEFTPCEANGCGKQVAVQQCHGARGKDENPCLGHSVTIKTCNEAGQKCSVRPGKRITEKTSIIIGGKEVQPPHNFPWMVLIESEGCGGSVITSRHILTAAHCVEKTKQITLKTGKHDKTKYEAGEQSRVVMKKNLIIHKHYDGLDNDIAIIVVDPPLKFDHHTQPILLPTDPVFNDKTINRKLCTIAGWGRTKINDFRGSSVLLQTGLKKEACRLKDKDLKEITDNMFCASKDGKDACFGDSGGPFMCRDSKTLTWTQYGIVSWGPSNSCGKLSGVYTNITKYLDWINNIISTNGGWGNWTEYTDCANGVKTRARICSNPEPIGKGICNGTGNVFKDKETGLYVDINTLECKLAAEHWGEWSKWSNCSTVCNIGEKFRTRKCIKSDSDRKCPGAQGILLKDPQTEDIIDRETEICGKRC